MSTLLRKVNPYMQLDSLGQPRTYLCRDNLGTLTTERLLLLIGQYIDSMEYSLENRFESNLINTVGLSAIALHSYDENIDMDDFDADGIYKLLVNNESNFNLFMANVTTIENRTFQNCDDVDTSVLQIACAIGKAAADYWNTQIANPETSPWEDYLPPSFSYIYPNAAIRGALLFHSKGA